MSGRLNGESETVLARAKVNLTLHVGAPILSGRWAGYHPIDSLVVFADFGDALTFSPAAENSLTVTGPFANGLSDISDNSIFQALRAASAAPQHVTLDKQIPIAAGLGGGTADAAAVLRSFDPTGRVNAVGLGADVPVCRLSQTAMMEGVGERLTPQSGLGQMAAVLVNPGVAVATGRIFKALDSVERAPKPAKTLRAGSLLERTQNGANDMEAAAIAQVPVIQAVLGALSDFSRCHISRMSGSGASCFGVFDDYEAANAAAKILQDTHPYWWVRACWLGDAS